MARQMPSLDPIEVGSFADVAAICAASDATTLTIHVPGLDPAGGLSNAVPFGWYVASVDGEALVLQRHSEKRVVRALSFIGRQ